MRTSLVGFALPCIFESSRGSEDDITRIDLEIRMNVNYEATLDHKYIEFAKLLNCYLNHFPKFEKYALTQEIRKTSYEMYCLMIEAQKRYHKKTTLSNLNIKHEQLRMLVRLAYSLEYFKYNDGSKTNTEDKATHRYFALSRMIDEIGRMIGGWMKPLYF